MNALSRLALIAVLGLGGTTLATTSLGCAKKSEPVEVKEGFQVNMGTVTLVRRDTGFVEEQDQLRYVLRVTNSLKGPLTVDKVDYSFGIGDRELGTGSDSPKKVVAVGATEKVNITGAFEWRQTSEMPAGKAWVKGTMYWTGPNNPRTTTFEFSKEYTESE